MDNGLHFNFTYQLIEYVINTLRGIQGTNRIAQNGAREKAYVST